jgi:hypothetical protein
MMLMTPDEALGPKCDIVCEMPRSISTRSTSVADNPEKI